MVFVVDDLGAWLVATLADAGRKRLTTVVLGSDQERALRQAAATAIKLAAADLYPESDSRAEDLAIVVNQVFGEPLSDSPKPVQATLLEELRAGIARQLAPLDDASLTGTRQSSADVLGVSAGTLAQKLAGHLVREIVVRGARGGPLAPLAAQLNHDVTHLQGQRIEDVLGRLDDEVRKALARLDATQRRATAPTVLAQLPPAMTGFTGRDGDLELLMELLDPGNTAGPVVVSAVAGLAGVGKTALAVEAGHAAQRHGWFPGGVLFLDLHGYDDQPTEPSQALDALLRALGLPADRIPLSADERAALYRSVLANTSDPVLVIADNASSEAQVRPMLPGVGPHKVLATSRNTLAALGARLVDVAVLEKQAAVDLLEAALQAARPEDDRLRGDLVAAGQLAEICGGLPLALQIAAALLKADPGLSVAELADELSIESERLEQLQYDDGSGLDAPSVATAFELSYRRLNHTMARLFRLLPLNPGPDVSTAAVAVMAAMPTREVRTGLDE